MDPDHFPVHLFWGGLSVVRGMVNEPIHSTLWRSLSFYFDGSSLTIYQTRHIQTKALTPTIQAGFMSYQVGNAFRDRKHILYTHMYIFTNTNTQRHTFWFVLHWIPVDHLGCYEQHFYSYFFLNVFVASDVCIPFIIVSFGVFFLFLSVFFMFGFVSFWFCLPGSLLLLSALRYLSQDNKLNNNHHNTRWI